MSEPQFLSGLLLLAMPGIGDPRFENAVIAMCAHNPEGALGIGLGHLHPGLRFRNLLKDLDIDPGVAPDAPVHNGGPVEGQRGFLLHSPEWALGDTLMVPDATGPKFALTTSREALHAIAAGHGPSQWAFALGYAGWGGGQLDGEMRRHGWYACEARDRIVFNTPAAARWTAAWKAEGIDPATLSTDMGNA